MTLRITATHDPHSPTVLKIEGRVVADASAELERHCRRVLAQEGAVQIDLAGVTFVDQTGLRVLKELIGAGVTLANATPLIRDLLDDTKAP